MLVDVPDYLVKECELYAATSGPDAVLHVLRAYPRLVSDVRQLTRRLSDFDAETADFDQRLDVLQSACRALLEL